MISILSAPALLRHEGKGIFYAPVALNVARIMTYRVYVRWPKQRISHKTVTPSKSIADAAWDELLSTHWDKNNMPVGLAYTHDGKQIDYVDMEQKDGE